MIDEQTNINNDKIKKFSAKKWEVRAIYCAIECIKAKNL